MRNFDRILIKNFDKDKELKVCVYDIKLKIYLLYF